MTNQDRYVIDVLEVATQLVEAMADSRTEYHGISELARRLNINRGRVFRILKTLERRGWVEFEPRTASYRLGARLLFITESIHGRLDWRREAGDVLRQLTELTGDSAGLFVLYGDHAVCVEQQKGGYMLQAGDLMGRPVPLYVGAAPKVLLANLPDSEREPAIDRLELLPFTESTITNKETLRKVLDSVRAQGYAVDNQDYESGVQAVGAPVRDHTARVVAAMSVITPQARYSLEREGQLINWVIQAANQVSLRLGHRPAQQPSKASAT
jgi:DNA-binding IclR family transcriptional regulator